MEQRAFTRQALNHDGTFSSPYHKPQPCSIRDFCKSGLFIAFDFQEGDLIQSDVAPFKVGDDIMVSFKASKPIALEYQIIARVARVLDSAMGLQISQDNPEAIHALYNIARSAPAATKEEKTDKNSGDDHSELLNTCRHAIKSFLRSCTRELFSLITDNLMLKASCASSNAKEAEYFEAITKISRFKDQISKQFRLEVMEQVDHWIEGKEIALPDIAEEDAREDDVGSEFSLVEKDQFEDWLVVKVIISKADQRLAKQLFDLQLRMSEISQETISDRNNPINPTFICHAFHHAVSRLQLDREILLPLFDTFEGHVIARLDDFYDQLNTLMIDSGIYPKINYTQLKGKANQTTAATTEPTPSTDDAEVQGAAQGNETSIDDVSASTQANSNAANVVPLHSATTPPEPPVRTQMDQPGAGENPFERFQSQQRIAKQAFTTAQNLYQIQQQVENNIQPITGQAEHPEGVSSIPASFIDTSILTQHLSKIPDVAPASSDLNSTLLERVQAALEGEDGELREADKQTIGITDSFFSAMMQDSSLQQTIKPNIKKLEVPLLKLLLEDARFFENEQHPARLILNRLAKLGMRGSQLNRAAEENIKHLVNKVSEKFDSEPEVFREALDGLDQILDKQHESAQRNTQRVVESCEGLQTIEKAKNSVAQLIYDNISAKWIPKILMDLLEQGWQELLVFTLLRDGESSTIYKGYAKVVEVLSQFDPEDKNNSDIRKKGAGMLAIIQTGIKEAPSGKAQLQKLVPGLKHLLTPEINSPAPDFIEVPDNYQSPIAAFTGIDEAAIQDKAMQRWIRRARRLKVGDWVEFSGADGATQIRLAWLGEDHHKFVFVNHQGMKVIEFSLQDMSQHLQSGSARYINNPDIPFVDQSLDTMVQNMYEQMNYQATHNEITGLINRKEFERYLGLALEQSKREQSQHIMMHLDLDQFKVINNACGHEAGNLLLKNIVGVMNQGLPEDTLLAHLGADEYAMILYDTDRKSATKIANTLRENVQNYRFDWDNKPYNVGASIGLFVIDEAVDSIHSIIDGADSARLSAKEAGKNRVHCYELNDRDRAERDDVMEKIAQLNRALDEERLQLRCQKIAPIDPSKGYKPHYEVLLSLEDEQGLHLAPGDFIHAAERYNRMHEVDRWVIRNVFRWMSNNAGKLEQLGGCTINLSGHSLNDDSLMSYIFEELLSNDIPREKVCFEITETVAVSNLADAADFISEMKTLGFKFALDDFGAGLSSYKYLKNLPVDLLKIDGAFVKNIATDVADYAMVKSINEMAHMMGKRTVAEYVEDDEILAKLREIGVDYAQGFGIEKPLPLNSVCAQAA